MGSSFTPFARELDQPGDGFKPFTGNLDPNTAVNPNTGQPIQGPAGNPVTDFTYGMSVPFNNAATLLSRGVQAVTPEGSSVNQWAQGQQEEMRQKAEAYQAAYGGNPPAYSPQRDLGEALPMAAASFALPYSTATFWPRLASNAAGGAMSGILTGDPNAPPGAIGKEAVQGGLLGATATPATGVAARVAYPRMARPPAPGEPGYDQIMMDLGVRPTPGQLMQGSGGWFNRAVNRLEQGVGSIPIIGDMIGAARSRSVDQLNTGMANYVLAPINETLEAGGPGREAVNEVHRKVTDAYNAAVPTAGGRLDPITYQELGTLQTNAGTLGPGRQQQFNNIMDQHVWRHVDPNTGIMTGQGFKDAESDLGKQARDIIYNPGSTSDERGLAYQLRDTQTVLRNWLERASPANAADIRSANAAYARQLRYEYATARPGELPGRFQPSQLQAGVAAYAPKSAVARGTALGENISDAGRAVLGSTVPDSGTPLRHMIQLGAGLGAAALAGHEEVDPKWIAAGLGGTAATAVLYNPLSQRLIAHMMATRYPWQENVATGIRHLSPVLAGALPPGLLGQQPY
jgi:hypothetical protein